MQGHPVEMLSCAVALRTGVSPSFVESPLKRAKVEPFAASSAVFRTRWQLQVWTVQMAKRAM